MEKYMNPLPTELGQMILRYREAIQLADAHRRRAEAAEAQVARLTPAAKIGDSCEMAGLAFIDDDGEVRMSPPREVFEEEIACQSATITHLTEEVERLRAEVKRLEEEADGEFVRAAVRVMQDNPGFDHHDYQDGITADDFEAFFDEDLREAWRCYEKERTRAEAAEARVEEMAEALEGLLDAVECVEQSASRRIIDRHAVEQARSTLCSKAGI